MTWAEYVHLAFDEIRLAGKESPQITRRLRAALEDLLSVAPGDRKGPLREQLHLLEAVTAKAAPTETDTKRSTRADVSGMG